MTDRSRDAGASRRRRRRTRLLPWVVLVCGLLLSVGAYVVQDRSTHAADDDRFRSETDAITRSVTAQVQEYESILSGVHGLFAGSHDVSSADFEEYVDSLLLPSRFPGVFGVAWVEALPAADAAARADELGLPPAPEPELGPGQLETSFLITHAEPAESLGIALGVDARLFTAVAEALERSRDTGTTALSGRFEIPLVEAVDTPDDFPVTFIVVAPVYETDGVPATFEDRREHVTAWAGVITQAEPFLVAAASEHLSQFHLTLHDGAPADPDSVVADVGAEDAAGSTRTVAIDLFGREWTLRMTEVEPPTGGTAAATALLGGGVLASVLMFALLQVITRAESRALRMVDDATEELSRQERHFRALVANSSDLVIVTDRDFVTRYVSPAAERLLGVPADELMGVDGRTLLRADVRRSLQDDIAEPLARTGRIGPVEFRVRHADGDERWLQTTAVDLLDDPAVRGIVWTLQDVTERHRYQEHLAHQATHDHLTGLPNRTLLLDRLQHALDRGTRTGRAPAVLFVDLDRFKLVNDSFGHGAGDDLLCLVADRLRQAVRPGDTVARFGGDEFVVLAEGVADREECEALAQRLASTLASPFHLAGREVFVSASIGIVQARAEETAERLLRDADLAMYRAKEGGRDRTEVYDERAHARALDRLETENALRHALDRNELVVHFQPQVDLVAQRVQGVEALVRWQHPQRGLLLPDEFLPLAEQTGLITRIGSWVLEEACARAREWSQLDSRFVVSVNLSARQIADTGLRQTVADVLERTGLEPSTLCLEITEGALMADVDTTVRALKGLARLGVRLAIDDFGTGYASLGHLKRFPVDVLKIDRSFVAGLGHDTDDTIIVAAVIGLAHALGVTAIAEGVETEAQLAELRALGCDGVQGHLYGRPVPADDLDLGILERA